MHFTPSQAHNMRFPPATHVCRLVSCGLLTVVRVIAGPWFVVGDRCPHNKHKRSFAKMITPATAPPIVRSGHRRPGGCRSDHPQYQYGSKPIYCGHRIFPTTPTAEIRSPRHCWRQRQCIGTTVLPLATTTRVAMGSGSVRRPSGMSRKAGGRGRNRTTQQSTGWNTKKTINNARWSGAGCCVALSLSCYCGAL